MIPKFACLIFSGEIEKIQSGYKEYLRSLKDGWYILTVKKPESRRTLRMNSYYWAVPIKMIAEHCGMTEDEVHEEMLRMFAPKVIRKQFTVHDQSLVLNRIVFTEVRVPKRSKEMSIEEMQKYWEDIAQWSAEFLNLPIPEPNQVEFENEPMVTV